ncbi:MAG: pyridine nucleotide-disulfide oxidoreductase [Betaproteobacteria bacterium HGW-Betaproteobacteria-12]|nr:MAG: pyridine nucleotide-disulfide oxidoreductase [Betaproteobacteria bacterium HGW-Betaproteobacteria-12]
MKRLILAGGGHAHLHVLKSLARQPWPGVEVVLVSPWRRQIYSGMVPGWMAGHYRLEQCAAALAPLARAAGVRFVQDAVSGLDAWRRVVRTANSGDLAYDTLSLDIGAEVDCSCLAASGARLLSIRPLEHFVVGWERLIAAARARGTAAVAVVGGGAAGVELALAARYRLAGELGAAHVQVSLVAGGGLLPGHGQRIVDRASATLAEHAVDLLAGYAAGTPTGLLLDNGRTIAADCVIAATGVRPAAWLATSGLALADDGFLAVGSGQQSQSHDEVFAGGDVASRVDAPHAKSGVYAVRAGPVLAGNLQRQLQGLPPLAYQPQQRSLYLLATGPRQAIVSWGGLAAGGAWAWRWKDWIDRRFMSQYDSPPGHPQEERA